MARLLFFDLQHVRAQNKTELAASNDNIKERRTSRPASPHPTPRKTMPWPPPTPNDNASNAAWQSLS
ncbi:hypothetical protein HZU72_22310 [Halomonas sp. QX-2]|uniref:Uncharacterized protein n=1 Tax=Vreelandella sedimenti TaxID=2729618 RepID=A0A7Z0NCA4_9GAMM|nr:hypothetical protein [Halomonas sedimenti]NYT75124.1 hypothetical protein [Halomonas sedimenti]